jgi:hypothetical protein
MNSDLMILSEGMNALKEKLGIVDAEKFITLIKRDQANYTEWRRSLWVNKSVDEIFDAAQKYALEKRKDK